MIFRLKFVRGSYQLLISALIAAALLAQFSYGLMLTTHYGSYVEQFFSYFTILSNIFVAGVFGVEALQSFRGNEPSSRFASVRGAAVFCILTTGVVYSLFLRGPGGQGQVMDSIPWINDIFHYIVPTVTVLDWLIFPPKYRINWTTLFTWLGLTIVYLALVEFAGLFSHAYPYFFLNPVMFRGYKGVLTGSAFFLPFFLVFSLLVLATANVQYRFRYARKKEIV